MMAKQLVVRIPRAMWRLFHVLLRRGNLTMQEWIDKAVGDEIMIHDIARGARHNVGDREFLSAMMRTVGSMVPEPPQEPSAIMSQKPRGASATQVIARIDDHRLDRLKEALRDQGVPTTEWLRRKIAQAVLQQPARAADMLSSGTLKVVGDALPAEREAREAMAYVLLDWPDEVVAEASSDPEYGLREALGGGDVTAASEILAVAGKVVNARQERETLMSRRRARHGRRSDAKR